jgi:hypothetical protein
MDASLRYSGWLHFCTPLAKDTTMRDYSSAPEKYWRSEFKLSTIFKAAYACQLFLPELAGLIHRVVIFSIC